MQMFSMKFLVKVFNFFSDIPEVEIRLGTSLKQNAIREGTDVYFDCLVNAHPPIHRVDWLHNVSNQQFSFIVVFNMILII